MTPQDRQIAREIAVILNPWSYMFAGMVLTVWAGGKICDAIDQTWAAVRFPHDRSDDHRGDPRDLGAAAPRSAGGRRAADGNPSRSGARFAGADRRQAARRVDLSPLRGGRDR